MTSGIVVIETVRQSLAPVDRHIELQLVTRAAGWIGASRDLCRRTLILSIVQLPDGYDPRGAFEKPA